MKEEIKEAFKEIVEVLIEVETEGISAPNFFLSSLHTVFMDALVTLNLEKKVTAREAIEGGLGNIFLQILGQYSVEITKKERDYFLGNNLKKQRPGWITKEVLRGAYGHEKSQPKDAI